VSDGAFADPGITSGERTHYRGLIDGHPAGEGWMEVEAANGGYVQRAEIHVAEGVSSVLELRYVRKRGTVLAESYRLESFDGDQPVSREEGWFRGVRALGWGGAVKPYPRNLTPLLGCALALRGLAFEPGERHEFAVWLANTIYWELEAHVERRETVSVPAGEFDAWLVQVRPKFEALGGAVDKLAGAILPPFKLHFAAEPTHRLVRFSFPTGPFPWNPRGIIQATELG